MVRRRYLIDDCIKGLKKKYEMRKTPTETGLHVLEDVMRRKRISKSNKDGSFVPPIVVTTGIKPSSTSPMHFVG